MKEVTITYKAEVTKIVKVSDESDVLKSAKDVALQTKRDLGADDVHVSKLKYFVHNDAD